MIGILKISSFFTLALLFSLGGGKHHSSFPPPKLKKYKTIECEAVMSYITHLWNSNNSLCGESKRVAGIEILKLITDHGCLVGKSPNAIREYLGSPNSTETYKAGAPDKAIFGMQYDLGGSKPYLDYHVVGLTFLFDNDSALVDLIVTQEQSEQ